MQSPHFSLRVRPYSGTARSGGAGQRHWALLCSALLLVFSFGQPARAQLVLGPGPLPEEQIEQAVEESVEETVEETAQAAAEERVEEAVEERVGELVLGPGSFVFEQKVEELVEEQVEAAAEESADAVIEEQIQEEITDNIEETVEATVEESVARSVEEGVEAGVEASVEASVEETIEESVAQSVEQGVEAAVESSVEESVAQSVEASVADKVEESVAAAVEADVEDEVVQSVESGVEQSVEGAIEEELAQNVEMAVEAGLVDAVEERLESEIDEIVDDLESELEVDESRIQKAQWLVMAEPQVFEELAEQGYLFDTVTELPGLGMRLAEVAGPSSFDITAVRRGVLDVVGKDRAEVDLNHIYTAGTLAAAGEGIAPRAALSMPATFAATAPKIGMIDSRVDTSHPALAASHIQSRSFVPGGAVMPDFHGTAIASIIAGNTPEYQGLAPNAELYAAAVFEQDRERGEIASTVSLIRALDWLTSAGVDVVNISLAGPANRLLEAALERVAAHNVLILAAAGNGGPAAQPMYPAAYESVVAITAVDAGHQVFRLANRGTYLDLAAPGVGLLHARAGGGYAASSGTSFAVPFATTAAAQLRYLQPGADTLALLYRSAEDLGPPGRDDIYGYGLLRFAAP